MPTEAQRAARALVDRRVERFESRYPLAESRARLEGTLSRARLEGRVIFTPQWRDADGKTMLEASFAPPSRVGVILKTLSVALTLLILATAPVALTLLFALPFWLASNNRPAWQALVLGFLVFNVVAIGLVFGIAYVELDWVAGLVWFMVKSFLFVYLFVWMRGTLPRVRIDQLMGFAWKWLLPAALLNLFITAAAIVVVRQLV